MIDIHDLYERYGMVNPGDLSGNQKKEMYAILKDYPAEALSTMEEHKMYVEVLQKLRQSTMDDMQLMGKKFLATLESLLSVGEDGVYSNKHRFIYELIQNVDDCEYNDVTNCNLEVQFCYHLSPAKIIFTYNEKGFTPGNVFGITGIAEASKNISADKVEIGEKGIGFKSVFGIADKVLIESGKFSFELYKNNFTVPIPKYDGFEQVEGTRLTLEMSPSACQAIYRSLVEQYVAKDAALNKNPILFLNKLTHLKMYFDGFRRIEFNVQRTVPENVGDLQVEKDVTVSIDMNDYYNSMEKTWKSEIKCSRYTMPIVYGPKECNARYGEEVEFTERRHNIIAVLPEITEDLLDFTGVMYSFLPTQIKTTAPIILHVPYKLDGSREFVDPQDKNAWFTVTSQQLAEFLKKVYLDYSRIVKEDIIRYVPNRHKFLFKRDNQKIDCLCVPALSGDSIVRQKIFYTTDGTYESANDIVAFSKEEVPDDQIQVHRLLGSTKKLFIPLYLVDMKWYNVDVITNIVPRLFRKGLQNVEFFEEVASWLNKNVPDLNYVKLISNNEPIQLSKRHIQVIAKYKRMANGFALRAQEQIKVKKRPDFTIASDVAPAEDGFKQTIEDLLSTADLDETFELFLKALQYHFLVVPDVSDDFVIPGKNGIVLSEKNMLGSFAALSTAFDPRKTFSASLQIRQASEKLDEVADDIENDEYLKLLRGVRISLKSAFGNKMYNSYVRIIAEAGSDKKRFLNELLQNSDDCKYEENVIPTFRLSISDKMLTVSYNEKGFLREDVRAITAIGESTKKLMLTGSANPIGEKGVGFKSVFGVAKAVEIHSNGFNFRLTDQLPTVPEKCLPLSRNEGTTMVFKMKENVASFFSTDRILQLCICLRNLKNITIMSHQVQIKDEKGYRVITLDGQRYRFERVEYDFEVTDKEALDERNANTRAIDGKQQIVCYLPDRIKDQDMYLYSGLPTMIKSTVPIILDAPFELTTSRENLLHSKWNEIIRSQVYQAILHVMDVKKDTGLEMLRYVGFRSAGGVTTWKNFDDEYMNHFDWPGNLRTQKILPILGSEDVTSANQGNCVLIPEFLAKIDRSKKITIHFPGIVVDTIGKSQYVPLLESIGCRKAKGTEILQALSKVVKDFIMDETFREGMYAYLSNNQGNIAFEGVGTGALSLPIIPVRDSVGTTYICAAGNTIYHHKSEISRDDYYILNDKILALDIADKILGKGARINELTQEVFDAKYQKALEDYIQSNRSLSEIARYVLGEFERNRTSFAKCKNTLVGLFEKIPFQMESGQYKRGKKFLNKLGQYFAGPVITSLTINEKYEKLAEFLGAGDIQKIHYDDIDLKIEKILDDDIEDLMCDFENFFEIIKKLIDGGLISDDQIYKYNLEFGVGGSESNEDDGYEEFPDEPVKNITALRNHIQTLWKNSPNPYIERQYIQWKPKTALDKKNYAFSMYQSYNNAEKCFCQMCRQRVPSRYIERNDIEKNPAYAWNQMYLNLCLNCSKDYVFLRYNDTVWSMFISEIMKVNPATAGNFEIKIGDKTITFTATHIAEVQEIFKVQGWGDKAPRRKPVLGNSAEDQTEAEKRAEIKDAKKAQKESFKAKKAKSLVQYFRSVGLEVQDDRPKGGYLWVYGSKLQLQPYVKNVEKTFGATGSYSAGGYKTNYKPAWFTSCKK